MRTEGLCTQVACRVLGVSESGFLRLAVSATVGPHYSPCVADRHNLSECTNSHEEHMERGGFTPNCGWVTGLRWDTTR